MRPKTTLPALAAAALLLATTAVRSADTPADPKAATGTATLTGKITDPAGKPAAKVLISLATKAKKAAAPASQPTKKKKADLVAGPTATTDDGGNFKIENLAAGEYQVTATMKNVGRASAIVTVAEGQTVDVKMQIAKSKRKTPVPAT